MKDLPEGIDRFAARLEGLEQRVCALENAAGARSNAEQRPNLTVAVDGRKTPPPATTSAGIFSLLGRALLGIAGAYLLRAVAESNVVSSALVAAVAIAYALAWLVWASRAKGGDWLTGTVYACTSALILTPMLWELTLRFRVLTAPVAAVVLAGFIVASSVLTWKRELAPVSWVANLTSAALALGLAIASREMIPFITVLLLMVLIGEWRALRGRDNGVRVVVWMAVDAALSALIFIYSSPESTRASYPQLGEAMLIAPGAMLFLIVGVSVILRTVIARGKITIFETLQTTAAFLLATCGLMYFGAAASVVGLGIACIVLAGAGYVVAAVRFSGDDERRNQLVFAGWSGTLMLAGSMMCLPAKVQSPWLGTWAIAASWASVRILKLHAELHGLVFLLAAIAGSGLLNWMLSEMTGTSPGTVSWAVYFITFCAIGCYAGAIWNPSEGWPQQVMAIVFAALATMAVTALIVQGLTGLIALKVMPGAHHLAFIRTLAISVAALGLAFGGARWGRADLTRVGYAALALLAVKLVVEDLRHGQLAYIAGSISLFAIALIVVPRLARMGQRVRSAVVVKGPALSQ